MPEKQRQQVLKELPKALDYEYVVGGSIRGEATSKAVPTSNRVQTFLPRDTAVMVAYLGSQYELIERELVGDLFDGAVGKVFGGASREVAKKCAAFAVNTMMNLCLRSASPEERRIVSDRVFARDAAATA